ncbi:unnamed protein product [Caenorhabditis nigoni]
MGTEEENFEEGGFEDVAVDRTIRETRDEERVETVEDDGKETCPVCSKRYEQKSLIVHLKNIHNYNKEKLDEYRAYRKSKKNDTTKLDHDKYRCGTCGAGYGHPKSVRRHMLDVHGIEGGAYDIVEGGSIRRIGDSRFECDLCHIDFTRLSFLKEHVITDHSDAIPDDYNFTNFETKSDFEVWFCELQKLTSTSFVRRDSHEIKDGSRIILFKCHNAGYYDSKSLWRVGAPTRKVVSQCPTFAKVVERESGKVEVTYNCKHNHPVIPAKLILTTSDITFLRREIKIGITDRQIISKCREQFPPTDKMYHITSDDIRNQREKLGVWLGRYDSDDLTSVTRASECNPDIKKFVAPVDFSGDGFLLVFMSDQQKEWMNRYGERGWAMDDTFNFVKYDLRLTTILVLDEMDRSILNLLKPHNVFSVTITSWQRGKKIH